MTTPIRVIPAHDIDALLPALAEALEGGPAVLPRAEDRTDPVPATAPAGTALVVETSGSTGIPKRVALSADALTAAATATAQALGGPGQWLHVLPAHYIAGAQVLIRSILAGEKPVVPHGRLDDGAFAAAVDAMTGERRYVSLVPVQLADLMESGDDATRALADLDAVLVGGQHLPTPLLERASRADISIVRTYGSSETAGGCVYDGVPLPGARLRVHGGEVEISGPMLATGYLEDPERTAAVFRVQDGVRWYETGDAGFVEDGRLRIGGRLDNVIVSGGINVSLDRVEDLVRTMPEHARAVVVGVPHARWGQVPVILTESPLDLHDVRALVTEHIGRAAQPARVIVVPEIPHLPSGKPDRRALCALAARTRLS